MVKKWIVALTVALSGLMIVSPSMGKPNSIYPALPKIKHKSFSRMTLQEVKRYQLRVISLDRWIIKTRRVHDPMVVRFARHRLAWARRELRETLSHLRPSPSGGGGGSWPSAVAYVQRAWPGSAGWLNSCSGTEGGHGRWVPNTGGSGAGGWMQFMSGTFYGNVDQAFAYGRARGLVLPRSARSWYSPLGQAATGADMLRRGQRGQWTGSGC